jgi:hypothetical protein
MNITFVVIFLIILIIIFFTFNFNRYFQFCFNCERNKKKYIKNFSKKRRIKTKSKIIVSITCDPSNINNIMPMLVSILDQEVRIDNIVLNIPYKTKSGETYDIPDKLKEIVTIYRCYDYGGKQNNIIPTLLRESEYGTIIISLDENVIYGKTFLKKLLKESMRNNNKALIFNEGMLVKPEFFSSDLLYVENDDCKVIDAKKYIKAQTILFEYYENYKINPFA